MNTGGTNANTDARNRQRATPRSAPRPAGTNPSTATNAAADAAGVTPAEVRAASAFAAAVNAIATNCGHAAKTLILSDHPQLPDRVVMQISRTHPDRQRFAIEQVIAGRGPLGKPPVGIDPPFDTHNSAEVLSRLARNAGALATVADRLLNTPSDRWPADEALTAIRAHVVAIRRDVRKMKPLIATAALARGAEIQRSSHTGRRSARPRATAFTARDALGAVARAAGVTAQVLRGHPGDAKNLRDLPRVLTDTPPTRTEQGTLLERLRALDAAATRLGAALAARDHDARTGPSEVPGTYIVFFRLATPIRLKIGALGTFAFPAGVYGYVGGAFGGGGVRKRTHRHLVRHSKNKKWNIDHLKPHCVPVEVWWTYDRRKVEFDWAAVLAALPGAAIPVRRFGSGDNPAAAAHLVHFARFPELADFERRVRRRCAGSVWMGRVVVENWRGNGWPAR